MKQRRPLIAGNWKMNNNVDQASSLIEGLLNEDLPQSVDAVVCPPYLSIPASAMLLSSSTIGLGAQNVHWESSGAFTAEVSAPMLKEAGVEWVIVGHSERRTFFGESDSTASQRALRAQEEGLNVIVCIGETLDERESAETFAILERQISVVGILDPHLLSLAYEPVWAIGTGKTASTDQAQEAHSFVRKQLTKIFDSTTSQQIRILYGGSLKPANAHALIGQEDVDGGLIGGASLDVASFSAIIRAAADCAAGD